MSQSKFDKIEGNINKDFYGFVSKAFEVVEENGVVAIRKVIIRDSIIDRLIAMISK
jgi:hypothetical protein